jgi:uncharacterized OsmC-like protein
MNLEHITPDRTFDGGDLDCGSGLVLLLRENMLEVPVGGVLEMRSREPTVADDLPPWCRLTGHEYLGSLPAAETVRYFVRRGQPTEDEKQALDEDKDRARSYEWRARCRSTGHLKSTVYFRNFSFEVGQPASFEEKDAHPSAVEYLLTALAGALSTGFATECAKDGLDIDDIEISIRGRLNNVLAHLGLEEGDPSFQSIQLKCFVSTLDNEDRVRTAWDRTVARSPLAQTLKKAVNVETKLAFV